ncbi:MAG: excinuclease ABC subunit UvrA [Hydrogenothermaceae bacterium]|nr:excinuclease ABC subunit UvrA [Hydrogenothermaceae bacterium]
MDRIVIHGARQHNLKSIDLELPKNKLIVITGPSGSGKSSLAFDTIYAEGQRRYVESLSTYARQFLGLMEKPEVDSIEGLSPAIAIDQKTTSKNPRSTVGTITEIYDYLRVLFARIGKAYCPECNSPILFQSAQDITESILRLPEGTKVQILSPLVRGQKGEHKELLEKAKRTGYPRIRVDREIYLAEELPKKLEKNKKHTIEVVVDRVVVKPDGKTRINDSVEQALKLSDGIVVVNIPEEGRDTVYSEKFACPIHDFSIPELSPRLFSFNSPYGACPACKGLGIIHKIDSQAIVDENRSVIECVRISESVFFKYIKASLREVLDLYGINKFKKFKDIPEKVKQEILYGNKDRYPYFEGIIPHLERKYLETDNEKVREEIEKFIKEIVCPECNGSRLRREALTVKVGDKNIHQIVQMNILQTYQFFSEFEERYSLNQRERVVTSKLLKEIKDRLKFLIDVGLEYLTLDRSATTLSGGEAQRIRLATQIGSKLTGVLYVLDEPSIGLHPRDTKKLISTLKELRDIGNTVIVVEHDLETIEEADYVVDIGPGSGVYGGQITAAGTVEEIKHNPHSLTGKYLSGKLYIPIPKNKRRLSDRFLKVYGARQNNLKNIDVKIPLGLFVAITGVSGSGKSTLVYDILWQSAKQIFYLSTEEVGAHDRIEGWEYIDKVINVDQSPIGRTPRSNPATYTKVFDHIRELFSKTPESIIRGYTPGRFSFNVKGGRCEACEGDGVVKIEMHFLPDVYVTCEVCGGKRYNRETLSILYKGKNIADILDMTVAEALEFFENIPTIRNKLKVLHDVGLDYLKLGQPATTLSGGEAQRIKLSKELSKRDTGKTLYLLDEPTTGLHSHDVSKLIQVLIRLVEKGNTVVVIEHNLDVIKCADWIIDLGPEGGDRGGYIVAEGPVEKIIHSLNSHTGKFLAKYVGKG